MVDVKYVKNKYEDMNIVSYYNNLTKSVGLFKYESILVKKYFSSENYILDLGCGTGRTTISMYHKGYKNIVGADISENMIEQARKNNSEITFEVNDAMDLPYKNNSFDRILFSFNGLMLIPGIDNRYHSLREIRRVLKPEGIFIFSTPYIDNKLEKNFWKNRIKKGTSDRDVIKLGDLFLDDNNVENLYIHIPLIKEVLQMIENTQLTLVEYGKRLNLIKEEDCIEEELDDNLYWVVRK